MDEVNKAQRSGPRAKVFPPWVFALTVGSALAVLFLFVSPVGQAFIYDFIAVGAVAAVVRGARRAPVAARAPWYLIASGLLAWAIADIAWHAYDMFGSAAPPFPGPIDILYVLGYPLLAVGLLRMTRRKARRAHDNIDSALLAVGLGVIVWVFLGAPYLNAPGYSGLELVTALAYPAGDAVLLGALARLFFAGGGRTLSRQLLFVSAALLVVTDGLYLQESLLNTYVAGGLLDTGWLFSYVIVAAAALHPSISDPERPQRAQDAKLSLARLSFAICLPVLGPALFSAQLIAGVHVNRVVIGLSIAALFVLSLARTRGVVVSFNRQLKRLDEQNMRLEKALEEVSEHEAALQFQARVLDQVESFVVVVGPDSKLIYMNAYAERYFGRPSEEAIDRVWNDVFGGIDADDLADLAAGMDDRGAWEGNIVISAKGKERVVHIAASHMHDEAGKQTATICVGLDITEGQELEDRLRRIQKLEAFGQLAGGIAHDFNNLLSVVLNYGRFLVEDLAEEDERRKDAQEIVRAGERGASLTRQLLTFSRKSNATPETLILNDVVREMARMLSRTIPENVRFTMDLADDLSFTRIDPGHMEQIIMNLVVNARDAMPDGGSMKLRTANTPIEAVDAARLGIEPGMYVSFSVSDEGTGIDEDTLSRIFEPFFTTKEVGKGTGLGLATVYGIVQQVAGAIDVSSELGVGSLFTVYLPFQASGAPTSRAMFVERTMQGNGERIIVTEDEDAVRDLVSRMLRRNGYEVKSYSSSEQAAVEIEEGLVTADLLLTDVVMPGLSGPDLARRSGLRTLLMTGYSNLDGEQVATLPTLAKPFDEAQLAAAVKSALGSARKVL